MIFLIKYVHERFVSLTFNLESFYINPSVKKKKNSTIGIMMSEHLIGETGKMNACELSTWESIFAIKVIYAR